MLLEKKPRRELRARDKTLRCKRRNAPTAFGQSSSGDSVSWKRWVLPTRAVYMLVFGVFQLEKLFISYVGLLFGRDTL